jgi:hypothetical protein
MNDKSPSKDLVIDPSLFQIGLKMKDNDSYVHVLVHIKLKQESDTQKEYCLTFRKVVRQECSKCGHVDYTINPYCSKCFLSYHIEDITNFGLHV